MLPVLYHFTFKTPVSQGVLYALALLAVGYFAWTGWRSAESFDPKGQPIAPSRDQRTRRALLHGLVATVVAAVGLYYVLPEVVLIGRGKGEGLPLHTYGILVGLGFVTAATVSAHLCQLEWPGRLGLIRRDQFLDLAFFLFVGALVGARVLFIIVNWKDYASDPLKIFSLGGGLVFYGGLIGATLTAIWYARKHDIDFLRLADVCIPTVSLGQALGRLGCFGAGCCWGDVAAKGTAVAVEFPGSNTKDLFGAISNTPSLAWTSQRDDARWVIEATGEVLRQAAPEAVRISEWALSHGHTLPVHPTQLYESLGQMLLFVGMLGLRSVRRFHGQVFGMWLMGYGLLRTGVELFRGDLERGTLHGLLQSLGTSSLAAAVPAGAWYNISTSQFISLCLFSLGAWTLVRGFRAVRRAPAVDLKTLVA